LYARLGEKSGRRLFEQLMQTETLRSTMTPVKLLGFTAATAVHGATLLSAFCGIALLVLAHNKSEFTVGGSVFCLLIAWFVRPRVARLKGKSWPREKIPALYVVADKIADELHAPHVDMIVLTNTFNASYTQVGWRGARVLTLGLPLLAMLNERERIAVIAHEVAHAVNRDATRTIIAGAAISSLARWYKVFYPLRVAFSLGATELVQLYVYTLNHLLWRDSQRAEYRADHLSARVAGTGAALSALHMLCLANTCVGLRWDARLIQDVAEGNITDLYEELRGRVARLPEREQERVKRVERLASFRLDATHPPTAYRIALLDARTALDPTVHLSPEESVALARELAAVEHRAQEQIVEAYKRRQSPKEAVPGV